MLLVARQYGVLGVQGEALFAGGVSTANGEAKVEDAVARFGKV